MIAVTNSIVYEDRLPTVEEFQSMFDAVGWVRYGSASIETALQGSQCATVATLDGHIVAMGRVVGDGGKFFYIQDVAVRPEHQGRRIGQTLICRLLASIERMAPGSPFIGVFATPEAVPLYRKLGLDAAFGGLTGMAMVQEPGDIASVCGDLD